MVATYSYNIAGDLTGVTYSDTTPAMTNMIGRSGQPTQIVDGSGTRLISSTPTGLPTGLNYTIGLMNGLGVTYGYDGLGRLSAITAGGRATGYGYRSDGRLDLVTHGGTSVRYGYKTNSDLVTTTTFTQGAGTRLTTTRGYDSADRIASVINTPGVGANISRAYIYNNRNQRTQSTLVNGDYWKYNYNSKGEVISGVKKNASSQNLLGHDYAYAFDEIGNRLNTTTNGNKSDYVANALNEYSSRTIPPRAEILGTADPAATVTVNNAPVQRQNDLFFAQLTADNSAGALYNNYVTIAVKNNVDGGGNDAEQQGGINYYLPKTPEAFTYDFDGNVLSDGRFNYTWDGENRLIKAESFSAAPATSKRRVDFIYDGQGRRVSKKSYTWNGTIWTLVDSRRFLYDQFNLLAEINDAGAVINSYAWGIDLSGSLYGAGGVGGLLTVKDLSGVESYPSYDANGNILAYVSNTGVVTSQFEYGPFGELIRSSGTAPCNFGFSTKYRDSETGLNYYGYRYYSAAVGRFVNRDLSEEAGGLNLYGFCTNNGVNKWDVNGLWDEGGHQFIINEWLKNSEQNISPKTYVNYEWNCMNLNVNKLLMEGNNIVDGTGDHLERLPAAQSEALAYQHAMRAPGQSIGSARMLYTLFIMLQKGIAMSEANRARQMIKNAKTGSDADAAEAKLESAIIHLGMAQHPIADSVSPAHIGFQVWYGSETAIKLFLTKDRLGEVSWALFVLTHHLKELAPTKADADYVMNQMQGALNNALQE